MLSLSDMEQVLLLFSTLLHSEFPVLCDVYIGLKRISRAAWFSIH